jgi:hypothetical protein
LFFFNQYGARTKDRDADGFMPRDKQFGYIFTQGFPETDNLYTAAAHELGHGIFRLEHTFSNDYKIPSPTDNLMDYSNGAHIAKWQWDLIHDPGVVVRVFEKDADAMARDCYTASRPRETANVEGLKKTTEGQLLASQSSMSMSMITCTKDWYYHIGDSNGKQAGWYTMNEYKDLDLIKIIRPIYVKFQLGEKLNDDENTAFNEFFKRTIAPNFYSIMFGELGIGKIFPVELAAILSGGITNINWQQYGSNIPFDYSLMPTIWYEDFERFLQYFESLEYNKTNYQGVGIKNCFLANKEITWNNISNLILIDYITGVGPEYFIFDANHPVTKKILGIEKIKNTIENLKDNLKKEISNGFRMLSGVTGKENTIDKHVIKKIINNKYVYVYRYDAMEHKREESLSLLGLNTSFDALLGSFSIMGILNEQNAEVELILFNTTNSYSGDITKHIYDQKLQPAIRGEASMPVPFSTVGQKLYLGKFKLF